MEYLGLLTGRLLVMFLFMMIGAFLFRKKIVTEAGSESLAGLLIYLILPCVIINGFLVNRSPEKIQGFFISLVVSILLLGISVFVSRKLFFKNPIGHFAAAFSNPGFFGIPLIAATLGADSVFYIAPFIACLNLLQWTYGVAVLKNERVKPDFLKIMKSPFMVSFILGMILFLTAVPIPDVLESVISTCAGLNTPVAMIVSGIYLAKVNVFSMMKQKEFYEISFVRLVLIPAVSLAVLCLIPASFLEVKMSLFLAAACPVGSNVAVYAQLHRKNYLYAVQTVVLSTLLSMVTIPLWCFMLQYIW